MPESAFKSIDPRIIAEVTARQTARDEWANAIDAFGIAEFGVRTSWYSNTSSFHSFAMPTVPNGMPVGWKWTPKTQGVGIVPDRRTVEGKAAWKKLEKLRHLQQPEVFGVAWGFMDSGSGGIYVRYPALSVIEGVAWCRWGGDATDHMKCPPWERVKRSEMYAMLERLEAQREADNTTEDDGDAACEVATVAGGSGHE